VTLTRPDPRMVCTPARSMEPGEPRGPALIAAICRAHGAVLATRNVKDFAETGIEIVDPWAEPD
jgi:hypothetical protein